MVDLSPSPDTVRVRLVASPGRLELLPGTPSDVFTYDGRVPGPTLEVREGQHVVVQFRNELPELTTVHWHGLHLPIDADGSPIHPVEPGQEYVYSFDVPYGSAGTYWYHPHPHHRTGHQIALGLYGAIVVRAADDPLPASLPEKLLILSDNRFTADGAIDLSDPRSMQGRIDFENGREGDVLFVNGHITPTITIRPGEVQRWRIINAGAARVYRLALEGHTLIHVGNDGGLFEKPIERQEIVIANAERVEVLVKGTGAPGSVAKLVALPYDRYIPQTKPEDWEITRTLLELRYASEPAVPVTLPESLRPVPPIDTTLVVTRRSITLAQGMIDSKLFDMERVDQRAPVGAVEIWTVENLVGMDHPFHLHGFQFQVLDRNGVPEPYRSWKDTVNIPKHQTVRFIVRFANYPGRWLYHCHILDHEDSGMMAVLEVY